MKITNRHIGYFIWISISIIATIYCFSVDWKSDESYLIPFMVATITLVHHLVFSVLIIMWLIEDDISFEFYIHNPFKSMLEAYKQKRIYLKELNEIYHLMSKTDSKKELDFLIVKEEKLKEILKIN